MIIEDRGPLAILFLNNNFHAVHHANPRLAWYRLPAEYARRRDEWLRAERRLPLSLVRRGLRAAPPAPQGPGGAPDLDPARRRPRAPSGERRAAPDDRARRPADVRLARGRAAHRPALGGVRDALRARGSRRPTRSRRDLRLMEGWTRPAAGAGADLRAAAGARARRTGRGDRRADYGVPGCPPGSTAAPWWCARTTRGTCSRSSAGRARGQRPRLAVRIWVDPPSTRPRSPSDGRFFGAAEVDRRARRLGPRVVAEARRPGGDRLCKLAVPCASARRPPGWVLMLTDPTPGTPFIATRGVDIAAIAPLSPRPWAGSTRRPAPPPAWQASCPSTSPTTR